MNFVDNTRGGLKKNKIIIIAFVLVTAVGVSWFGESVRATCDYCSEPNCADYLICEDWDIGTPTGNWPCLSIPESCPDASFNGWITARYSDDCLSPGGQSAELSTTIRNSGTRSFHQVKEINASWACAQRHTFADQTKMYVRLYIWFPSSVWNNWTVSNTEAGDDGGHFFFINTGNRVPNRIVIDIQDATHGPWTGSPPIPPCFLSGQDAAFFNFMYGGDDANFETNSVYCWNIFDHLDEWIEIEWMFDRLNNKFAWWINGEQVVGTGGGGVDQSYPTVTEFTSFIISGFKSSNIQKAHEFYIDDIVVSTNYIGPINTSTNDTTPSSRSNPSPTGTLDAGTVSTNISLSTDVQAICRYSNVSGTNYTDMSFNFTYTNSTNHSTPVSGLENGETYTFYVRCNSTEGYVNVDDWNISFSVDGHKADTNDDGVISMGELMAYIVRWKTDDGVTKAEVLEAKDIWFNGGVY